MDKIFTSLIIDDNVIKYREIKSVEDHKDYLKIIYPGGKFCYSIFTAKMSFLEPNEYEPRLNYISSENMQDLRKYLGEFINNG